MSSQSRLLGATIALALSAAVIPARAGSGYTFTSIVCPGAITTIPEAINNSGQVVGFCNDSGFVQFPSGTYHAFIYSNGQFTLFDVPGASGTIALAISDSGTIYGTYFNYPNPDPGLFQYQIGIGIVATTPPDTLLPAAIFTDYVYDITGMNANGVALGSRNSLIFTVVNGVATPLAGAPTTYIYQGGINSAGAVATGSTLIFPGGIVQQLPGNFTADGIGPSSDALGTYTDPATGIVHGAVYKNNTITFVDNPNTFQASPGFGMPPSYNTYPIAENSAGWIVGDSSGNGFLAVPPAPAASEKTRVFIDMPNSNVRASGLYTVAGWATNDTHSVATVSIQVDGTFVGTAVYGVARPDVCAAFANQQDCPNVGWTYSLDTTRFSDGTHLLQAVATVADGSHAIAATSFTINNNSAAGGGNPIQMFLDTPSAGGTVSGKTTVSGWAFRPNAATFVTVLVDPQNEVGGSYFYPAYSAYTSIPRPDVCAAFNNTPGCSYSGWSFTLDTTTLSNGLHTLQVTASDGYYNGLSNTLTTTFNVSNNSPAHIFVDVPASNAGTISGPLQMAGWAIDSNVAIAGVSFSVDGRQNFSFDQYYLAYGSPRPDVCAAYPQSQGCPNVGWAGWLSTDELSNGPHTITFTASSTQYQTSPGSYMYISDTAVSTPITFIVNNPDSLKSAHVFIDTPSSGQVVWNTPTFQGWAIDDRSSIARVDVYIDGTEVGSTYPNQPRGDVCAVYPGRLGCPNVGWTFTPNTRYLTNGVHTLTVVAVSNANSEATTSTTFNVQNGDSATSTHVFIDAPANGSSALSGTTTFYGWAFNQNMLLSNVALSIDNLPIGTVTQFGARPDVCNAYPEAVGCPNVGWSVPFDTTSLSNGVHVLKVTAQPQLAYAPAQSTSVMFTVSNAANASPVKSYIDVPAANATLSAVVSLSGWALDQTSPIASVVLYIDGVLSGEAYYGVNRTDVCAAFPNENGCPAANVGWAYVLDTTLLTNGPHTLQVESLSTTGDRQVIAQTFSVSN